MRKAGLYKSAGIKTHSMWYIYNHNERLRSWCWITAWIHLLAAIVFGVVQQPVQGIVTPTTKTIGWWMPASVVSAVPPGLSCPLAIAPLARNASFVVQPIVLGGMGSIDGRTLIVCFHVLSFLFQASTAIQDDYYHQAPEGIIVYSFSHFVEYSLSAPLMVIAMCAQFGITDVFLLTAVAVNCWACMIFGLLAEQMFYTDSKFSIHLSAGRKARQIFIEIHSYLIAHLAGWVTLASVIIIAVSNLATFNACTADSSAVHVPGWVIGLAATEFSLFSLFGLVQLWSFWIRTRTRDVIGSKPEYSNTAEAMYITLSIVSKLTLGLFIFIGNSI